MKYTGACHCQQVRFEIEVNTPNTESTENLNISRCNCSICTKSGFLHLIVDKANFHLISGESALTIYQFNTGIAKHTFCKHCGIKAFYQPRSHPNGVSVNYNCLDQPLPAYTLRQFDGQNWEAAMAAEQD